MWNRKICVGVSWEISTELETDTAWTFEPHPPEYARKTLREAGWDEKKKLPFLCSVQFILLSGRVKASVAKYIARVCDRRFLRIASTGLYISFNRAMRFDKKYRHYISSFGKAVAAFREKGTMSSRF